MNAKQAVAVRIQELCKERGITVNTLANMAGTSLNFFLPSRFSRSPTPNNVVL